jgi:hypothetical protein
MKDNANDRLKTLIYQNFRKFLKEKVRENPENMTVRDFLRAFKD